MAGLRAAAALPAAAAALRDCAALADAILAETARTATHPDGYWQRALDDPRPDAALLLPAVRGALPGSDPRTIATLRAVRDQLAQEEYVCLLSEEYDVAQRQLRGNLPQASVHGLLLECAATLAGGSDSSG